MGGATERVGARLLEGNGQGHSGTGRQLAGLPTSALRTRHVDVVHLGPRRSGVGAQRVWQRQVVRNGQLADALAGGVEHHVHLGGQEGRREAAGREGGEVSRGKWNKAVPDAGRPQGSLR